MVVPHRLSNKIIALYLRVARGKTYHDGALQERLRNAGIVRRVPAIEDVRIPYPARVHIRAVPEAGLVEALRE